MKIQFLILAAACAALVACGSSGVQSNPGTGSTGGTTGSSAGTTGGGGGGFSPCDASNKCPSGEFCFNGVCAEGCNSDGDCASNQYCDTGETRLCQDKTVATCSSSSDCASTQVCQDSYCTTPPPSTSCQVTYDQNDGCDVNSVCLQPDQNQASRCYSFPACAQDGSCPVGAQGAVCNEGYLSGKGKICLPTLCKDVSNCPSSWKCVRFNSNDVLGNCSQGSPGSACATNADCLSGQCQSGGPGFPGVCM